MCPAIQVDRAIRVRTSDAEDVDLLELGELDDLDAVRRQKLAHAARRLAACVRLELVLVAVGVDRLGPWLEGNRRGNRVRRCRASAAWQPHTLLVRRIEDRAPFGVAGDGSGRRTGLAAAPACGCTAASIRDAHLHARTLWLLLLLLPKERVNEEWGYEQRRGSAQSSEMSHRVPLRQ